MRLLFQLKSYSVLLLFGLLSSSLCGQQRPQCSHFHRPVQTMGLRSEDPGNMRSDTLDILKYSLSYS